MFTRAKLRFLISWFGQVNALFLYILSESSSPWSCQQIIWHVKLSSIFIVGLYRVKESSLMRILSICCTLCRNLCFCFFICSNSFTHNIENFHKLNNVYRVIQKNVSVSLLRLRARRDICCGKCLINCEIWSPPLKFASFDCFRGVAEVISEARSITEACS
jgi:hypothetical protein